MKSIHHKNIITAYIFHHMSNIVVKKKVLIRKRLYWPLKRKITRIVQELYKNCARTVQELCKNCTRIVCKKCTRIIIFNNGMIIIMYFMYLMYLMYFNVLLHSSFILNKVMVKQVKYMRVRSCDVMHCVFTTFR